MKALCAKLNKINDGLSEDNGFISNTLTIDGDDYDVHQKELNTTCSYLNDNLKPGSSAKLMFLLLKDGVTAGYETFSIEAE